MNILIGLFVCLSLFTIFIYNSLVKKRAMVKEAWSGVDVQLQRRYELLPNLLETVKSYSNFEKKTLERVVDARSKCLKSEHDIASKRSINELALNQQVRSFIALVENYPDLKASESYQALFQELVEIEEYIQKTRRYYNGTVRELNIYIESFPQNLIAKKFNFEKEAFFEFSESV